MERHHPVAARNDPQRVASRTAGRGRRRLRGRALVGASAFTFLAVVGGCADGQERVSPVSAADAAEVPGEQWSVESPESHGIDPDLLDDAREYAFAPGRNTQGVVVVHEGAIVAEWYDDGADEGSWATSASVAKSFTGALIGIAIDDGLIDGVDQSMATWFPDWVGTPREVITLRDVLQMQSGLEWDEYDSDASGGSDAIQMMINEPDKVAYAASRPLAVEPGTRFNYSSGDAELLAGVLQRATGMSVADYAREQLFDPIGIDDVRWWQDTAGNTTTNGFLDMASRDFARFGLLYLRNGAWGDRQVVPRDWVEASITDLANTTEPPGYGYLWWVHADDYGLPPFYSARGMDYQMIRVFPGLDLVVVRNGLYRPTDCFPVIDPFLDCHPPMGLRPGAGAIGPEDWDNAAFLGPIVDSLGGKD